eukprot:12924631-Prorocentrum_lima.AAC.1
MNVAPVRVNGMDSMCLTVCLLMEYRSWEWHSNGPLRGKDLLFRQLQRDRKLIVALLRCFDVGTYL